MSDNKGLPVTNWVAGLYDANGYRWTFDYTVGRSNIKVRPFGAASWTNQIQLADYGMKPEDVTDRWLEERARAWIDQYDADVSLGNI